MSHFADWGTPIGTEIVSQVTQIAPRATLKWINCSPGDPAWMPTWMAAFICRIINGLVVVVPKTQGVVTTIAKRNHREQRARHLNTR
jgi:hypothetical protein